MSHFPGRGPAAWRRGGGRKARWAPLLPRRRRAVFVWTGRVSGTGGAHWVAPRRGESRCVGGRRDLGAAELAVGASGQGGGLVAEHPWAARGSAVGAGGAGCGGRPTRSTQPPSEAPSTPQGLAPGLILVKLPSPPGPRPAHAPAPPFLAAPGTSPPLPQVTSQPPFTSQETSLTPGCHPPPCPGHGVRCGAE